MGFGKGWWSGRQNISNEKNKKAEQIRENSIKLLSFALSLSLSLSHASKRGMGERERDIYRETDRQTDRQRETDRQTERERETHTQTDSQRESLLAWKNQRKHERNSTLSRQEKKHAVRQQV